ncbi:hypothetical protein OIU78_020364 [Salix suchowensis]|nr:hypothetical protein OIU78_020364 [Salix suchowensis]
MESILHLLFLLQFLPLLSSSESYNPQVKYFINCGSASNVELESPRIFVGDKNSNPSFSVGKSNSVQNENPLPDISPLYHTARTYTKIFRYMLDINQTGSYLVRLHFFSFSFKKTHLIDALFNVSASNFSLLSNFSVRNSSTGFPVIKEFFLPIAKGNFDIYFIPADETRFAFVNAIEAFLLPPHFFIDDPTAIPPLRTTDGALRTLYRINVGGPQVNDTLWRNWVPDDDYLTFPSLVKTYSYDGELQESRQGSPSPGTVSFYLNISANIREVIDPNSYGFSEMRTPLFYDYMVSPDDSGYMSFSIAPNETSIKKVAFLNGLEIMEFLGSSTINMPVEHERRKHLALIIGSAGGVALILVLILVLSLCLRLKRLKPVKDLILKNEFLYGRGRSPSMTTERTENASIVTNLNLKLKMSLAEILAATENFNPNLLIGEGGFGKVYKGTLESGMKVAVKRSDSSHGQGLPEFQAEIMVLSRIQHRHLVSLVGYCDEGLEMILVYEFMEKGTLRDHLYDRKECLKNPSAETAFTWKQRLEICIGSAKGLHYLHTGPDGGIIHRDVKSTNILLDEHYVAKVADFGLSQSGMFDSDHISTSLKVLCARPPIVNSKQREEINLAEWGMFWRKEGQLEKIIDPLLVGHINRNSLRKFGEIAEKCLKPRGADRPNMLDVCWDLEYALQLQQTPAHREAHENSTTTAASTDLALPLMQNLNYNMFPVDDYSDTTASAVFSQLRVNDSR